MCKKKFSRPDRLNLLLAEVLKVFGKILINFLPESLQSLDHCTLF